MAAKTESSEQSSHSQPHQASPFHEYLYTFNVLPRTYIRGLIHDTSNAFDTTFGPILEPHTNLFKMGNSVINFSGADIVINDKVYKGTADFPLTPEGDINAGSKRIRYVSDPLDDQDCGTKAYTAKYMQHVDRRIDMRKQLNWEMSDMNKRVESKISDIESLVRRILEDLEEQKLSIQNIIHAFDKTIKTIDVIA
ncbi:hypothetical protein Trydic_g9508 [Trypoxylus dichotomus]